MKVRVRIIVFLVSTLAATAAIASPAARHPFAIAPQRLADAIDAFSAATGIRVDTSHASLPAVDAPALSGTLTAQQALERLLSGTGWTFTFVADTHVVLVPPASPEQFAGAITVLGSRVPDAPLSNVPASISIVTREEIERERGMSGRIEDTLAHTVPGFNPTNNGVRNIRGRTAQVWLNGAPVNEQLRASSGGDLNLLLLDQIAGIEVSRGASSAYGFGSPGGIIALTTPRATSRELELRTVIRESFNPHQIDGSHQALLYQSVSRIVNDTFDFHVGGALSYDGLEHDSGGKLALGFDNAALLTNGEETIRAFDTSVGFDLRDRGRIRFTGTWSDVDIQERYFVEPGTYGGAFGSLVLQQGSDDSFRKAHTASLSFEDHSLLGQAVRLEVFSSSSESVVIQDFGRLVSDEQQNEYAGFRSSVTSALDALRTGARMTWGVDGQRNRYYRPVFEIGTGELFTYFSPDVTLDSLSAFAQMEIPLTSRTRVSAGARREHYSGGVETTTGPLTIAGGDIRSFDLTLFNAGVTHTVATGLDVYASFSQGAEISQLGRAARAVRSADLVDPQPAKSNQYELGARSFFGRSHLAAAVFYTESDLLSALRCDGINPCTPLREPREFWGVEVTGGTALTSTVGIDVAASWQDGNREVAGVERPIGSRDIPPVLISTTLDYDPANVWNAALQLNYRGARDPFDGSTEFGEGPVEAALIVNALAGLDTRFGRVHVGVENLFNTEYTSIAADASNSDFLWLPEEGMRVTLSFAPRW